MRFLFRAYAYWQRYIIENLNTNRRDHVSPPNAVTNEVANIWNRFHTGNGDYAYPIKTNQGGELRSFQLVEHMDELGSIDSITGSVEYTWINAELQKLSYCVCLCGRHRLEPRVSLRQQPGADAVNMHPTRVLLLR